MRGELNAGVVDLITGRARARGHGRHRRPAGRGSTPSDSALRSIARHGAGTAGDRTRPHHGPGRPGQLGCADLRRARHPRGGSLNGASLATLALVPLAAFELVSPLPAATQALQRSRVAAGRVSSPPSMHVPPSSTLRPRHPSATARTRWHLHDVWATYPGAGRAALRGIDLDLRPGRRVALVGPSGAGKSTLADVLVRFLAADAGEATLDGTPLERMAADDVRRVVGLVVQRAHLFDTTLTENLRVGRRTATDHRAHRCARPGRPG